MMDLLYFGYDYELTSANHERDFKEEITHSFPEVEMKNAYDQIKGYRQEVYLPEEKRDDYYCWLIGKGWFEMSMSLQLMRLDKDKREDFKRLFDLTKQKYPEAFK